MALQSARVGGTNFIKTIVQHTPGGTGDTFTLVQPTNNAVVSTQGLKAPFDMINEKVLLSSRFTNQISDVARVKPAGPIEWWLSTVGADDFLVAVFGAKSTMTAIAPVVTTGPVTRTGNVDTIPAVGGWVEGAIVNINVDQATGNATAATEQRTVLKGSASGSLLVKRLKINAAAAAGIYVTQPAQDKYANSLLPSQNSLELPCLTIEQNLGKLYSWLYGGAYVDKFNLDYSAAAVKAHADIVAGAGVPVYVTSSTASDGSALRMGTFNPTQTQVQDALKPFNGGLTTVAYLSDPEGTGTISLQTHDGVQNLKMNYDNKIISEPIMNGEQMYGYWPGDDVTCQYTWDVINTAGRNAEYTDLVRPGTATPMHVHSYRNNGTAAAPKLVGVSLYSQYVKLQVADENGAQGKTNSISITANAMPTPGGQQDLVTVFVAK